MIITVYPERHSRHQVESPYLIDADQCSFFLGNEPWIRIQETILNLPSNWRVIVGEWLYQTLNHIAMAEDQAGLAREVLDNTKKTQ